MTEKNLVATQGKNLFAHFDVEADGPSPAFNNMISIGVVVTNDQGAIVGEFLGDLEVLPDHVEDAATSVEFWNRDENNRAELARIRANAKPPLVVMQALNDFLRDLKAKRITWVARPAAYDWQWLNYYQYWFLGNGGVGSLSGGDPKRQAFKAICASTMRDVFQNQWKLTTEQMESQCKVWTEASGFKMTHNPLDDARFQAVIYHKLFDALSLNKFNADPVRTSDTVRPPVRENSGFRDSRGHGNSPPGGGNAGNTSAVYGWNKNKDVYRPPPRGNSGDDTWGDDVWANDREK